MIIFELGILDIVYFKILCMGLIGEMVIGGLLLYFYLYVIGIMKLVIFLMVL